MQKIAIIIGAGPAGLTAAYELLTRTDIRPVVLEKSDSMGGIARTVRYKGNRIDIGGHRFFSKSDRVMNWWLQHLPVESASANREIVAYHGMTRAVAAGAGSQNSGIAASTVGHHHGTASVYAPADCAMLVRPRKSRIYFLRKFFDYPVQLSTDTLRKLGVSRSVRISMSYLRTVAFPIRKVRSLEHFFINRFGRELYRTFFKSYTEKVWGVACAEISAAWGEQRIKGLSIRKTLSHQLRRFLARDADGVAQKRTETSLIEKFLYPKYGPGQMWEIVAEKVRAMGGQIFTDFEVIGLETHVERVLAVRGRDQNGCERKYAGDYFFSTMPIQELIRALGPKAPRQVREISEGLIYRDFVIVGLLLKQLKLREEGDKAGKLISDNWIYIQEPDVQVARLQIFNNWSPHLVRDQTTVWIGAEYFCNETDELWKKSDRDTTRFAVEELHRIGVVDRRDVLDSTVIRMPKTYPAYFGAYARFDELRRHVDGYDNLFLIGRNGMHKYNNQDHSMLTAMTAVDNIIAGRKDKSNIWAVNTEMEYHEEKQGLGVTNSSQVLSTDSDIPNGEEEKHSCAQLG